MTETNKVCPPSIKISVAIITFNEESNIRRAIDSVRTFADEILVVDSHSQDDTASISRKMGARVIERDFPGYIEQKNLLLTNAITITYSLSTEMRPSPPNSANPFLPSNLNGSGQGYSSNRINRYVDQWIHHCGWYPDTKLRLVDRRLARWKGVNPHDILQCEDGSTLSILKAICFTTHTAPFQNTYSKPIGLLQSVPGPIFKKESVPVS